MNKSRNSEISSKLSTNNGDYLLSIVIPTFNRQFELIQLLDQLAVEIFETQNEIEVLVSNNDSTDQTSKCLEEYVSRQTDKMAIRCFTQASNIGAPKNLHFLIKHSRSKYIWAIGDDDLLVPGKLYEVLELLRTNPVGMLLVRADGIGEWDRVERSLNKGGGLCLRKVKLCDKYSADYLFAGGFMGSVIINAEKWMNVVPQVEWLHETCYANWAAVLKVAVDEGEYSVINEPCVRGNVNMQSECEIPAFHVLVMGRVKVWSTFAGTPLESVLRDRVKELACMGWVLIARGKMNNVVTLSDKLNALRLTLSLLGLHGLKSYFFALVSILFPFPKVLEKIRVALKDH